MELNNFEEVFSRMNGLSRGVHFFEIYENLAKINLSEAINPNNGATL